MDYKDLREKLNKSLSSFIISGILLVIGICFIPLTFVYYKNEKVFNPGCLDAIFMYLIFAASLILFILGLIYLIKYLKAKKSK